MPVINVQNSLRPGIINALADTWEQDMPVFLKQQELLLHSVPYSTLRRAEYGWKEALPFPEKWDMGKGRTYKTITDRLIQCHLMPFEISVPFNLYDEQDDQLGDLRSHLSQTVKRFAQVTDKLIAEYLNGLSSLNDFLAPTYDGSALFSATDGNGVDRYFVPGGNIVQASGLGHDNILSDVALAQQRFLDMRDTEEEVMFTEDDADFSNLCIIAPNSMNEVLQKATKQEFIKSDPTINTAESNYQKGTWEYRLNPYLVNPNQYFVILKHSYWKPFIFRHPNEQGIRSIFADFDNSDRAREHNEAALMADVRYGLSPWFMGTILQITL